MNQEVVINGNLISYNQTQGQGAGLVLVFLHGWRSQKEIWQEIVNQVIKLSSYQVYAIDLPGFGMSPSPQDPWTVGDYAEVVKGFIEKLELNNVVIVGHSFGGRVGIKLASKYPTMISKLVLADSAGFAMEAGKKNFYRQFAKIARPFFKPRFMWPLRKKIYQKIGAEDYVVTPELRQTFINIVNEDLTEDVKRINIPTLIIWGENDKETPVEFGTRMQNLINNSILSSDGIALSNDRAKFIILPNAGHFSFLDQPEEFVKALIKFIE